MSLIPLKVHKQQQWDHLLDSKVDIKFLVLIYEQAMKGEEDIEHSRVKERFETWLGVNIQSSKHLKSTLGDRLRFLDLERETIGLLFVLREALRVHRDHQNGVISGNDS